MIKNKQENSVVGNLNNRHWNVNELIELFVELNFEDITNETLLMQFRLLAFKIGFPKKMVEHVIKLGMSEYVSLMKEVEDSGIKKESTLLA